MSSLPLLCALVLLPVGAAAQRRSTFGGRLMGGFGASSIGTVTGLDVGGGRVLASASYVRLWGRDVGTSRLEGPFSFPPHLRTRVAGVTAGVDLVSSRRASVDVQVGLARVDVQELGPYLDCAEQQPHYPFCRSNYTPGPTRSGVRPLVRVGARGAVFGMDMMATWMRGRPVFAGGLGVVFRRE